MEQHDKRKKRIKEKERNERKKEKRTGVNDGKK